MNLIVNPYKYVRIYSSNVIIGKAGRTLHFALIFICVLPTSCLGVKLQRHLILDRQMHLMAISLTALHRVSQILTAPIGWDLLVVPNKLSSGH